MKFLTLTLKWSQEKSFVSSGTAHNSSKTTDQFNRLHESTIFAIRTVFIVLFILFLPSFSQRV